MNVVETLPLFPAVAELVAHYACRTGGASAAPFASLNLGFSTTDDAALVVENRLRLARALDAPLERWVVAGQVHGAEVARVTTADCGEGSRATSQRLRGHDAVLLAEPGVFALALSADCPLVVLADVPARRAGVAHAGWRGTALGVIEALVAAMEREGSRPSALAASISPGIGGCCYEVGEEVFSALAQRTEVEPARRGRRLDLRMAQRAILRAAGIDASAIQVHTDCNCCQPDRYFSHRRDAGRTGRNGAVVGWR
ncbi:MAG: polyphenol oxidase family protein [Planctomycetota bacterium]